MAYMYTPMRWLNEKLRNRVCSFWIAAYWEIIDRWSTAWVEYNTEYHLVSHHFIFLNRTHGLLRPATNYCSSAATTLNAVCILVIGPGMRTMIESTFRGYHAGSTAYVYYLLSCFDSEQQRCTSYTTNSHTESCSTRSIAFRPSAPQQGQRYATQG